MKHLRFTTFIICFASGSLFNKACLMAQSTYSFSDYAVNGDTLFLTQASLSVFNFDTTGSNMTWDYTALTGASQRRLRFRLPSQTGFTAFQWPYINNPSNVNLSSTDDNTISAGNLQYTEPNDYFLANSQKLEQKAFSSKIVVNATSLTIKTVYATPDVVYKFPLAYNNSDSSVATYTSSIPGFYYKESVINRKNTVVGWGSISTPYGTFNNCLKLISEVIKIDSLSIDTIGFPKDTSYYREYKWFDHSAKYPLLYVKQTKTGNTFITQTIEYLDNQQFFQPSALFGFYPIFPLAGDTVLFQNLSSNTSAYSWNFSDPGSSSNTSTLINPNHVFANPGIYPVTLVAYNGTLSDTFTLNVIVDSLNTVSLENPIPNTIKIFPNPTSDHLNISTGLEQQGYFLYNSNGNLLLSGSKKQGQNTFLIDLSAYQNGLYYLELRGTSGSSKQKILITK